MRLPTPQKRSEIAQVPDIEQNVADSIGLLDVYRVQAARLSNLNDSLYQIPPIFSTVIGGLWYFGTLQIPAHRTIAVVAFAFAVGVGLAGAVSVHRLRLATNKYYDNMEVFEREFHVSTRGGWIPSTVRAMTWMMLLSSLLSVTGAVYALFGGP